MASSENLYRLFEQAIPEAVCDVILQLGDMLNNYPATVDEEGSYTVAEHVRHASVAYWNSEHWISGLVTHYAALANRETWKLDLRLCQVVQYITYPVGGFYGWHQDELSRPFGSNINPNWEGMVRKVSVSVNLSDPTSYVDGDLLLRDNFGTEYHIPMFRTKGSVIVFPSSLVHCVTPVSVGVRKSLASWFLGPSAPDMVLPT